jgi:hypothetical protein
VDLGEIIWCLGMRITTSADRHTITLDLEQYLTTIVARYEFEGLQSVPTPDLVVLEEPSRSSLKTILLDVPSNLCITKITQNLFGINNKVLIIKLYPCATNGGNVMVVLLVLLAA